MWRMAGKVKPGQGGGDLQGDALGRFWRRRPVLALPVALPIALLTAPVAAESPGPVAARGAVRLGLAGPRTGFSVTLIGDEAELAWEGGGPPLRWPALSTRLLGVFPLAGREVAAFVFTPPQAAGPQAEAPRTLELLLIAGAAGEGMGAGILGLELWHWEGEDGAWLASTLDAAGAGVELRLVRYAHPAASGPNAVTYWTDHLFWREGAPLIDRPPRPPPPASWPARLAAARARLIAALTPPPTHLTKDLLAASGLLAPARLFAENGG